MSYKRKSVPADQQELQNENADTGAVTENEAIEQQPDSKVPDKYANMSHDEMAARLAELQGFVDNMRAEVEAQDGMVTRFGITIKEGTVLRDPFSSLNPTHIKKHPEGLRLMWCNPVLRERMGWNGWKPVTYDSEIGARLEEYIGAPPARFEGIAGMDNYVRRGKTSLLCSLPLEIWLFRQIETEDKSNARLQGIMGERPTTLRADGSIVVTGSGLEDTERPQGGFRFRHEGNPNAGDFLQDSASIAERVLDLDAPSRNREEARINAARKALHN